MVTGSVNQLARESGTSDVARAMLAQAGLADVTMAPAADMFELGVEVQVLRRGTLFAQRAARLLPPSTAKAHEASGRRFPRTSGSGPAFLHVPILHGTPSDLPRPREAPPAVARRFAAQLRVSL